MFIGIHNVRVEFLTIMLVTIFCLTVNTINFAQVELSLPEKDGALQRNGGYTPKIKNNIVLKITKSSSGQFVCIYKKNNPDATKFASAILIHGEQIKQKILEIFFIEDDWRGEIYFNLLDSKGQKTKAEHIRSSIAKVNDNFIFQIFVPTLLEFDNKNLNDAIIKTILAEIALRNIDQDDFAKNQKNTKITFPDWLISALRYEIYAKNSSYEEFYFSAINLGHTLSIEDLVASNYNKDSTFGQKLFEIYSNVLFRTLLEGSNGRTRMLKFVRELDKIKNITSMEILGNYFPELNTSKNSLSKWWSLKLFEPMNKQTAHRTVFTPLETSTKLEAILNFGKKNSSLAEILTKELAKNNSKKISKKESKKLKKLITKITQRQIQLLNLWYKAFPDYRIFISQYDKMLHSSANLLQQKNFNQEKKTLSSILGLSKRKNIKNLEKLISDLKHTDAQLDKFNSYFKKVHKVIDDFILKESYYTSDKFHNYFNNYEKVGNPTKKNPQKNNDPISNYIDFIEKETR